MPLTSAQLTALKAHIAANTNTVNLAGANVQIKDTDNNGDVNIEVAAWYNLPVADYWVWKSFVRDRDIYEVTTPAPDNTSWSWTIFIARSQGERDAWRQMVNMAGGLNPSLASVRTGVADIFSGTGGANQRAHLLTLGRRLSTNIEKLLAVATVGGVGNRGITTNPDTMAFEGAVTGNDITAARNS